jgi:hypothetical protein
MNLIDKIVAYFNKPSTVEKLQKLHDEAEVYLGYVHDIVTEADELAQKHVNDADAASAALARQIAKIAAEANVVETKINTILDAADTLPSTLKS